MKVHWLAGLLTLVLSAAEAGEPLLVGGRSMGTTWSLRVADRPAQDSLKALAEGVQTEFDRVEQIFSLYREDSELSRFNAAADQVWLPVSDEVLRLVHRARELSELTGGAFDPTVEPLVRLWKLREFSTDWQPPARELIEAARNRTGLRFLEEHPDQSALKKKRSGLQLDLSALVEGLALDSAGGKLRTAGCRNFLLELGGEFLAAGEAGDGQPWRVAIADAEDPARMAARVELRDQALSTSGLGRQERFWQGRRFSHLLDPHTGWPVEHHGRSVSLVAGSAVEADGLATALLLAGPEAGARLARDLQAAVLMQSKTGEAIRIEISPAGVTRFRQPAAEDRSWTSRGGLAGLIVLLCAGGFGLRHVRRGRNCRVEGGNSRENSSAL